MKKLTIYFTGLMVLITTSCDEFLDINTSPNDPSSAPVNLVFPAATGSAAYVIGGWYQILGGMWSQHWTQSTGASQHRDIDSYDLQTDKFDDRQFGELYSGSLNDLEYIRITSKKDENWSYYLMATVMQSYGYQVLVDIYDQIPFAEALNGNKGVISPTYNQGSVVYDSLIERINYALSKDLSAITVQVPGNDDVIFQGDLDKWVQFANTLKLKIYIREATTRADVAQAGIQSLFADPNFLVDDAAFRAFKDEVDNRNPVYETGVDRLAGNLTISRTLFDFLAATGDPRIDDMMDYPVNTPGVHNTLVQGDYLATSPTNIQGLSTPKLGPLDPVYFISTSESYFLQAEAVVRFAAPGDAAELYQLGVDASFVKFGSSGDPSDVYGAGKDSEFPSSGTIEEKIQTIINQKWVAMVNSQGLESWFEQNRTGYPDFLTPAVNNVTSDQFPKRLFFPQSERSRNPANVPTIEPLTAPVWWAK